jgi:hypothetical protein
MPTKDTVSNVIYLTEGFVKQTRQRIAQYVWIQNLCIHSDANIRFAGIVGKRCAIQQMLKTLK